MIYIALYHDGLQENSTLKPIISTTLGEVLCS